MTVKQERYKTAQYRFFLLSSRKTGAYRHTVCDSELNPKPIAQFKVAEDAELFLEARRKKYVEEGL